MSKENAQRWKIVSRNERNSPLRMAEPRPRIGPEGTTSGVSLRASDVPQSSVQRVKEICLHYVRKCSGKYVDNKTAARYVHQMADEVIGQLAGIIAQIQRYEAEPELYQALLNDWEENFPLSLGAVGTPKAVANSLAKQAEEIRRLTTELEAEKMKHDADVNNVLRSMDAQLLAYRSGIVGERRQISIAHDIKMQENEQKISMAKEQFEQQRKADQEQFAIEMQATRKHYDKKMKKLEEQYKELEHRSVRRQEHREKEIEKVLKNRDAIILAAQKHIKQLKEENLQKTGILANMGGDDLESVVSLDINVVESADEELSDSESESTPSETESESSTESEDGSIDYHVQKGSDVPLTPTKAQLLKDRTEAREKKKTEKEARRQQRQQRKEQRVLEKKNRKEQRAILKRQAAERNNNVNSRVNREGSLTETTGKGKDTLANSKDDIQQQGKVIEKRKDVHVEGKKKYKSIKIAGVVADGVRKLKEEISSLKLLRSQSDKAVQTMQVECDHFRKENAIYIGRLRDLDQINEELRQALKLCLSKLNELNEAPKSATQPHPLCHTPHFLGKADKKGFEVNSEHLKLSGYKISGHY